MKPSSRTIPNFVKARTPNGVRRLFASASARRGGALDVRTITHVNGEWFIWFIDDISFDDPILNEQESNNGIS